jgi:hypothetical protein
MNFIFEVGVWLCGRIFSVLLQILGVSDAGMQPH